jgi:hypothetical protein
MHPGRKRTLGIGWKGLSGGLILFALLLLFLCGDVRPSYALDVTLQWDASKENNLAGYIVYYKAGHSGDRIKENYTNKVELTLAQDENPDPNVVEFTVKNLIDGQNYAFVVTTFDNQNPRNERNASNEASMDNVPPPAVTALTRSHPLYQCLSDHTVKIYWTEPVDPEPGSGLGGYSWVFDGLAETQPSRS